MAPNWSGKPSARNTWWWIASNGLGDPSTKRANFSPPEPVIAAPDSSVTYTPAQLHRDLRVMRDALEEGHPGIYRFVPKPELDRSFQAADTQLIRPMTALQFYRVLAPLAAPESNAATLPSGLPRPSSSGRPPNP